MALALALLAAASGCSNPTTKPYENPAQSAACLRKAGYAVTLHFPDLIASTAAHGALRASRDFNNVTILFASDGGNASDLLDAYARVMPKRRAKHITDFTEIERNALLLWVTTPPAEQLDEVVACLR